MSREIKTDLLDATTVRLANNGTLISRNAANTADIQIAHVDDADELIIGDASTTGFVMTDGGMNVVVGSGTGVIDQLAAELFLQGGSTNALLSFYDLTSTNKLSIQSFVGLTATTSWLLPNGNGTAGQVLGTDGANPANLAWVNQTGGGGGTASGVGLNVPDITAIAATPTQLLFTSVDAPIDTNNYTGAANILTVPANGFYWLNINAETSSGFSSNLSSFGYAIDGGAINYFVGAAAGGSQIQPNGSQLLYLTAGNQITLWILDPNGQPYTGITVGLASTGAIGSGAVSGVSVAAPSLTTAGGSADEQIPFTNTNATFDTDNYAVTANELTVPSTTQYWLNAITQIASPTGTLSLGYSINGGGIIYLDSEASATSLNFTTLLSLTSGDAVKIWVNSQNSEVITPILINISRQGASTATSPGAGASISASSTGPTTANTPLQLPFSTVNFDTVNFTVPNPNSFTVTDPNRYDLIIHISSSAIGTAGTVQVGYSVNNGSITNIDLINTSSAISAPYDINASKLLDLNTNDTVQAWVTDNIGGISYVADISLAEYGGGGSGGGGADQHLSNLTSPTAINQPLLFDPSIPDGSLIKLNHTYISPFDRGLYLSGELSLDSGGNWTYHGTNTDASVLAVNRDVPSLTFFTATGCTDGAAPGSMTIVWNVDVAGTVTQSGSLLPAASGQALGQAGAFWGPSFVSLFQDTSSADSIDVFNRQLIDNASTTSVDWQAKQLLNSAGAMLDWSNGSILVPIKPVVFDGSGEFSTTGTVEADLLITTNNPTYAVLGTNLNSGNLTITTGPSSGTGNTGTLTIASGTPAGSGTRGGIILQNGSEGTAGWVWTSTDTAGTGAWVAASGGTPTGDDNTVAYFGASGTLKDNINFQFSEATQSFGYAAVDAGGSWATTGEGSMAFGRVQFSGGALGSSLESTGLGSLAFGNVLGDTSGAVGTILSSSLGSLAFGYSEDATIQSAAPGAVAGGYATSGGSINNTTQGGFAFGVATNGGLINSDNPGSIVFGYADGASSNIYSGTNAGTMAWGSAQSGSIIQSDSVGSTAFGAADTTGGITAAGTGAVAFGHSTGAGSSILANSDGALAFGFASGGFSIASDAPGGFAGGAPISGSVQAAAQGSFAFGDAVGVSAEYATAFGVGNSNNSYASLMIGQYCPIGSTSNSSWVSTDPVFAIGNGASSGSTATAFEVDKDGRVIDTASHVHQGVRILNSGANTVSARTDYKLLCDTTDASAAAANLPAGEQGLTFRFSGVSGGAFSYTVTPNGGDLIDSSAPTVIGAGSVVEYTFLGGTWYAS